VARGDRGAESATSRAALPTDGDAVDVHASGTRCRQFVPEGRQWMGGAARGQRAETWQHAHRGVLPRPSPAAVVDGQWPGARDGAATACAGTPTVVLARTLGEAGRRYRNLDARHR